MTVPVVDYEDGRAVTTEFVRAQIEGLLAEAASALRASDWSTVRARAETILALDPANADAAALLAAAGRATSTEGPIAGEAPARAAQPQPTSFAGGRYTVSKFLGEGGKKKVYLAHDAQLDRDVAFALIKTEGLDEAARVRVTREAQAMGRLGSHPHIVTVYDIGEENGQPYLVLPVLPGGDVEGVIEDAPEHKLSIEQAVKIATETCLGLEFSHSKGIIHRDLKPGNVWLAEDGRAMIGDFGLAVAVDRSRLTQAGMMVGTVSYMPPEQAMGGEVTPQSDLYSLGAMLYEMVCGRPPFVGDESVAIIGQHLNTPPVAPTWHRPDCPPGLEVLILRLLEKDATKRPGSATEVREALQTIRPASTSEPSVHQTPEQRGVDPLYRTVFVGREQELRQLQQAYDAAVSGQGGLVMVVGEPGIGKTALCEQLATYVSIRGGRTLVGHCYEEGSLSLPYLAFVEAMRTYVLARDPEGLKSDLGTGAVDVARIISEVRDRVQVDLRDAADPEDDRWRLLQSITTFLTNAALVQPLVIVLEDLHWADRGTLDLLQHVARSLQGTRIVIVGTYRDVEVDRTHPLSGAVAELRRAANFLRVPLRGLTVDEVHRMYEAVRGNEVPWGQAEAVHRQTEGNPLFVQEVLRYLVEEGIVVREDGRYVARTPGEGIPDGLRDVIGRRLSHLSEKTNEVLAIASVMGRDFTLGVLQRVAGLGEEELLAALEEAAGRSVIEQREATGTVGFRFTHAFFRQTLYEEIFAPRRIRWHQQVGRALEESYARRLEEHAAELAEHFAQSTEAADLEKAVRYGEMAAHRAMAVYAYAEAARHLEQALRAQEVLDPDDRARRCGLLLDVAKAQMPLGDPRRVADVVCEEAFQLASMLDDDEARTRACRIALEALSRELTPAVAVSLSEFQSWLERGAKVERPSTGFRAFIHVWQSILLIRSDRRAGLERIDRAFQDAVDAQDYEVAISAAIAAIFSRTTPKEWQAALDMTTQALSLPRSTVSSRILGLFLQFAGGMQLVGGDRAGWDAAVAELSALADRVHDGNVTTSAIQMRLQHMLLEGTLEEAVELAESAAAGAREIGIYSEIVLILGVYARSLLGLPIAEAFAEAAVDPRVAETLFRDMSMDARRVLGSSARLIAIALDGESFDQANRAAAWEGIKVLIKQVSQSGMLADVSNMPLSVALLGCVKLGSQEDWKAVVDLPEYPLAVPCLMSTLRLQAEAALALGDAAAARKFSERGLETCQQVRNRTEAALCALQLAELLLDHYPDEHDAAIEHLDFAIAEFRHMKMQPALERALGRRGLLKA